MRKLCSHKIEEGTHYVTGYSLCLIDEKGEAKTFAQEFDVPLYVFKSDVLVLSLKRKYDGRGR